MAKIIKRFIVTNSEMKLEGYNKLQIDDFFFYFTDDLKLRISNKSILIGNIFSTTSKYTVNDLLEQNNMSIDKLEEILYYMSGRYLLIKNGYLINDMCGNLATYWVKIDSFYYISNDLTFFKNELNLSKYDINFKRGEGFNYMPGPLTIFEDVRLLMPYEILHLGKDIKLLHKTVGLKNYKNNNVELVNMLKESYRILFENVSKEYTHIKLALTGGIDSRTNFALMRANHVNFSTFSHWVNKLNSFDKDIPYEICKKLDVNYTFIENGEYLESKEVEFDDYFCNSLDTEERNLYSHQVMYPNGDDTIVIKSGIFEGMVEYFKYDLCIHKVNKENFSRWAKSSCKQSNKLFDSFEMWFDEHPTSKSLEDFYNDFYLQIRIGSWGGQSNRYYDLINSNIFHPVNSLYIASLLNSFPRKMKLYFNGKKHEKYIIKSLCPEISNIKYNDEKFLKIVKEKIKNISKWNLKPIIYRLKKQK